MALGDIVSPSEIGLYLVPSVAALAVLVFARATRERPPLRPLLGPLALTAAVGSAFFVASRLGRAWPRWAELALLVPLLVLLVRGTVLGFQALFRTRQGMAPPALLDSVLGVLLYAVGTGAIAHEALGVELTPFLATSAVVGAVVGLALQDTLGNLFTGIALHTEAPFRVGDWVRTGESEGRVEEMSWRAIRLKTWDGDTLTIPNNEVARRPILNLSSPRAGHMRALTVGVNYQTPPNKVVAVLRRVLDQIPDLPSTPPATIRILAFRDFSVDYEVRYPVPSYEDYRPIEGEIRRLVWYHFRRHAIEIPYPIRNVFVRQMEPGSDAGDAPARRLDRALRGVDLFRPLSDEELRTVAGRFRNLHFAAGERIIEEGSAGDSFFIIDRGEVEVVKTVGGVPRVLARLMEGQFFGEMALLTGEARTATVVAATDADVFALEKAGFEEILQANPAIAEDISTILVERREALNHAEADVSDPRQVALPPAEAKLRLLGRIRRYFGL
jgi:small-conductance mechanosensitive channel/CRP-like cAMP-binding protein